MKYPAGLDIGAKTPEEVALSILTEIVQRMRAAGEGVSLEPANQDTEVEAIDPICNMTVNVADARYHLHPQWKHLLLLLPELQAEVRPGAPSLRPPGSHVAASGTVVLYGQHLSQDGQSYLGGRTRPDIQAYGRPDAGEVGIAKALSP